MKTLLQNQETDLLTDRHWADQDQIQVNARAPFHIDSDYYIGLICLAFSFSIFLFTRQAADPFGDFTSASFMFSYGIAIFYLIWLFSKDKIRWFWKKQYPEYQSHRLLLGFIWLVSCFALNTEFPVFHESASWLSITIIISAVVCIAFTWEQSLPGFLRKFLFFLFGASAVLWVYYAIYLVWLYPLSIIAIIGLGLSVHSFIPLLLSIAHIKVILRNWSLQKIPLIAGILAPLIFTVYYIVQWNLISQKIQSDINAIATKDTENLPSWVYLGQNLDHHWITKQVIIGNLAYQMPRKNMEFGPQNINMNELIRHDPLVLIASLFTRELDISKQERTKLLNVLFEARHYTQERLWSGSNLSTENVVTQARIYPEFRLAYTEKTISIGNHAQSSLNSEEALYTFYLPAGSVVSSLSLWINDREEKGYLTTQTKADSAYKTIVGVETRDPSVIHWQEGNVVRVKVFPCTPKERRKFKIGITSPLTLKNDKLVYENIYFKGPPSADATEGIRLDFSTYANGLKIPFEMKESGARQMIANGKYRSSWNLSFDAVPLSDKGFTFNAKTYQVKPFKEISEPFSANTIYLDINNAWTKAEFDSVYQIVKNRKIWVYDEGFIQMSASNKERLFNRFAGFNYSLFPVHEIANVDQSLLITKETQTSPNVKDLRDSPFGNALKNNSNLLPVKAFNIGNELSPYFKTLHELRIVRCEKTDIPQLKEMLSRNQFPKDQETDDTEHSSVRIDEAKMIISESDSAISKGAPDHIARLYAYNHIMQQIGKQYLSKSYLKDSTTNHFLIEEAEKAHIVTPVSSLIVLETAEDYKRFDIQKSKNSLDNATVKNSGAVPEPHEWALIILFALLVVYYTFRNYARW